MKFYFFFISLLLFGRLAGQTPLSYVNPFIGTAPATTGSAKEHGAGSEEKGQTYPAIGRPFGMTQWTLDQNNRGEMYFTYYYNDRYITGFRGAMDERQLHTGLWQCTLMPFTTSRPDTLTKNSCLKVSHKNETASPAYYRVLLDNSGIVAELTGSVRSGIMRFTFPGRTEAIF